MAEREGYYWDHQECAWVRCPQAAGVQIPEQPAGVEAEQEADVRSG